MIVEPCSILSVPQTFVSLYIEWLKIMRWMGASPFHENGVSHPGTQTEYNDAKSIVDNLKISQ